MNTLSSGYSASAQRSVSGTTLGEGSRGGIEEESVVPKKSTSVIGGARRNRLVAPPPSQYVTSDPGGEGSNGDAGGEQKGRMLYAYQANSDGEISVQDGVEVTVVEEDGMNFLPLRHEEGQQITNIVSRRLRLAQNPHPNPHHRSRTHRICRPPPAINTASRINLLRIFSSYFIFFTGYVCGEEKGAGCCPEEGSKEIEVCGGAL
jgi:hypothetical protein